MAFKFAISVEFKIGYQPAKFQCGGLYGSSFTEGLGKHNDDVISYYWDSISAYFVKLNMSCQPSNFHNSRLFE